jgi:hypothetical protein
MDGTIVIANQFGGLDNGLDPFSKLNFGFGLHAIVN